MDFRFQEAFNKFLEAGNFNGCDKEFTKHKLDLLTTAQKIKEKYPGLLLETWFAEMKAKGETSEITFIKI